MTKTQVYSCTLHRDTDTVCTCILSFPPYLAFHLYEVAFSVQLTVTYVQCFFFNCCKQHYTQIHMGQHNICCNTRTGCGFQAEKNSTVPIITCNTLHCSHTVLVCYRSAIVNSSQSYPLLSCYVMTPNAPGL